MSKTRKEKWPPISDLFPCLWPTEEELERATTSCLARVFLRMFAALLTSAVAALIVVEFMAVQNLIYGHEYVFFGLMAAEIILVLALVSGIDRISAATANAGFFFFALINGLTMSVIFFFFDVSTIFLAFSVSALMFAVMAVFGATTHRDLTTVGSYCIMGLIGIIIASIANFFLRSGLVDFIVSYAGVLVFIGLTAHDTQSIKRKLRDVQDMEQSEALSKISVFGALTLYLNFLNLFLKLLRIRTRKR